MRQTENGEQEQQTALLSNLMAYTPDYFLIFDLEGRCQFANQAVINMMQIPLQALLGATWRDLQMDVVVGTRFDRAFRQVIETEKPVHFEETWPVGGKELHLNTTLFPVFNAFNQMNAVGATHRDITTSKETESTLHEAENRYRLLADYTSDLIALHLPDGTFTYASPSFKRILGYSLEDLSQIRPDALVHPDDLARTRDKAHKQVLRGETVTQVEYRIRCKSGHYEWVEAFSTPIKNESGEIVQLLASSRIITERKQAERALMESEERFRKAFEFSPVGMAMISLDGQWMMVNPSMVEIVGYTEEELRQMNFFTLAHAEEQDENIHQMQLLLRGEIKEYRAEKRYFRKNGQVIWVILSGSVVRSNDQSPLYFILQFVDITQRKQMEETLKTLNQDLENFAYIVSHDLKAPLRGISTIANWLTKDYAHSFDDHGQELLGLLMSRTKRMDALISGVLDYSRAGRNPEQRDIVNLETLVRDIVEIVVPADRFEVIIDTPLPHVKCEPSRLEQVLQNLLSNAVKFTDKPHGEIRIACQQKKNDWVFSVSDNGPGIDEKHFTKIFQIFQTLKSRDEMENTGIGLAIAKRIVELWSGKIWVESTPGVGTTFYFTLPVFLEEV